MRRFLITALIVAVLGGGAYAGYRIYRQRIAAQKPTYQTMALQYGNLTVEVGATGTVRANQSAQVLWQTNGQVDSVGVTVGQKVSAGQELASLKPDSLPQSLIMARSDLISAQKNLDTLLSSSTDQAKAKQNLVEAQKALDDASRKRELKNGSRGSIANTDAAEAQYILAENQLKTAQNTYSMVASFSEMDPARAQALSLLANAQQKRDTALANLNYLKSKPNTQEIAQADADVVVAQANLKAAQQEWNRLKNGPDPKEIQAAEARVQALQVALATATLKAPIAGTVTEVDAQTGDSVVAGAVGVRIDDLSKLLIDAPMAEIDINQVKAGQIVRLTFDAVQGREYSGIVESVARTGSTNLQGSVTFNTIVRLTDADDQVLPGMTAAVNIVTQQENHVLLVPNRAIRQIDGKRYVFILRNDQAVREEIQTGASSDSGTVVTAGNVEAGDLIILNPPSK
jgi:HlyD family secretion protein